MISWLQSEIGENQTISECLIEWLLRAGADRVDRSTEQGRELVLGDAAGLALVAAAARRLPRGRQCAAAEAV